MPDRPNPLKLNPLQAKTLALLQELASLPDFAGPVDAAGNVPLRFLPEPHGDHFHVGSAVVRSRDATGLANAAVFGALSRKGLIVTGPRGLPAVTPLGRAYDTGLADQILHRSDH
ncbi:MAG: hypothetical protein ACJ8H8_11855 [Geminicoccaceae bacterium]